jgi:hypothetical protein
VGWQPCEDFRADNDVVFVQCLSGEHHPPSGSFATVSLEEDVVTNGSEKTIHSRGFPEVGPHQSRRMILCKRLGQQTLLADAKASCPPAPVPVSHLHEQPAPNRGVE